MQLLIETAIVLLSNMKMQNTGMKMGTCLLVRASSWQLQTPTILCLQANALGLTLPQPRLSFLRHKDSCGRQTVVRRDLLRVDFHTIVAVKTCSGLRMYLALAAITLVTSPPQLTSRRRA